MTLSATPKRPPKPRRKRDPGAAANPHVTIRMYNVGFGDCFLVTAPGPERPTRILFDCGSIAAAPGVAMDSVLAQLWKDATDPGESDPRIDVIVATHRHRDHVSGFAKAGWERVRVAEVWMPWTEHPTDEEASRIRETQARLAATLHSSLTARLGAANLPAADRPRIEQWLELAGNALSNERAMTTLHEGLGGNPKRRFLPEPACKDLVIETGAFPGVTAFVLGPSRDKEVIRDMEPPAGKSYLRLLESKAGNTEVPYPFSPEWTIDPTTWAKAPKSKSALAKLLGTALGMMESIGLPHLSIEDQKAIAQLGDLEQAVAVSLDKAVNGTSLMIVLKVGQAHLLFPGDAQWGTWQAAMGSPAAGALLKKTKFYKVGHHGSHNATPKTFVEKMIDKRDVWSMVSTRPVAQWPEIPRVQLLDELTAHGGHFVRSDQAGQADPTIFHPNGELYVEVSVPIVEAEGAA